VAGLARDFQQMTRLDFLARGAGQDPGHRGGACRRMADAPAAPVRDFRAPTSRAQAFGRRSRPAMLAQLGQPGADAAGAVEVPVATGPVQTRARPVDVPPLVLAWW